MFEGLSEKFQNIFSGMRKKGKLDEADIKAANKQIKLALLEADVNFKVVKSFTKAIGERAKGEEVLKSLTPSQQYIKIVKDEMINMLGGEEQHLNINKDKMNIFMMVGLQGAGKTTTAAKIANLLRKEQKLSPLLVAADIYRPAAMEQLKVLGKELDIPVYCKENCHDAVEITLEAKKIAEKEGHNLVIIDTAGRLQIDDALMQELSDIDQAVETTEKLLVVDGMAGQESVNISKTFDEKIGITGVVLTKLDGDTRGGAALSVAYTTQRPIYFIGTGEKLSDIELFHPDRMASRILGMGDVLSLIDKAQDMVDEEQAKIMEQKIRNASFDLNDFVDQLHQVQKLGSLSNILEMLPGVNKKALAGLDMAATEKQTKRTEAIIFSMTPEERSEPDIINGSRRKRIANGSGTSVADVNRLLKGFEQSRKMMKQMGNMGKKKRNKMKWPFM